MKDKYIDFYITDHNIDSSNYLISLSQNLPRIGFKFVEIHDLISK